jgi:hypothetical protein
MTGGRSDFLNYDRLWINIRTAGQPSLLHEKKDNTRLKRPVFWRLATEQSRLLLSKAYHGVVSQYAF